jgi:hypothetical protein
MAISSQFVRQCKCGLVTFVRRCSMLAPACCRANESTTSHFSRTLSDLLEPK